MPKRVVLKGQTREFVVRLQEYFEKESSHGRPLIPVTKVRDRVAAALGIGTSTVTKICKVAYDDNEIVQKKLSTPMKKRRRPCRVTAIDDFNADGIRRHVYDYYLRKEIPTLRKMLVSLRTSGLFCGQKTSLAIVLKQIGFNFKNSSKKKFLMERHDIALARCEFLRKAKEIKDWSKVVFTNETCLNASHRVSKSSTDDNAASTTAVPVGKGEERLIICHAGTAKGFVDDALLAFKSKYTGDYRKEINEEVYENWFRKLLFSLKEPSTVLLDNAPYHSRQINRVPNNSNKKEEIINWLCANGKHVDDSYLRVELLKMVNDNRPQKRYVIDEMAAECGHTVLRVPPYHSSYNAIEHIWAQVKESAARKNTTPPYTGNKMMQLVINACGEVTAKNWESVVAKTKNTIFSDWEREVTFDQMEQEPIIDTQDTSDDESSFYEESDSSSE